MKKSKFLFPLILILVVINLITLWDHSKEQSSTEITDEKTVIGILPFGNFPGNDIDSVQTALKNMYELEVIVLESRPLPANAFINVKSPRYRADSLLDWMASQPFEGADILIGLTAEDISTTKYKDASRTKIKEPESRYKDFGIFGLGRVAGDVCIVSSFRLKSGVSKKTYFKRLTRIASHEIGHVLGLHHCPEKKCLMNDANESIQTIDVSTGELCKNCWSKIH